jgi:hypothetical protein
MLQVIHQAVILHYYLPNDSSLDMLIHRQVTAILPFSIDPGLMSRYEPVHATDSFNTPFVDLYRSTGVLQTEPPDVSVIISHRYARYDAPDKFTLGLASTDAKGNFKYLAWSLPRSRIITIGLPDGPADPHAPKLLAHELLHIFREDADNRHCSNYIDGKRCIMNPPPEGSGYAELDRVALKFCDPCYRSAMRPARR